MNIFDAIETIENPTEETTREDVAEATQYLIDSGQAWTLQGFYGRLARDLIETGECHYRN